MEGVVINPAQTVGQLHLFKVCTAFESVGLYFRDFGGKFEAFNTSFATECAGVYPPYLVFRTLVFHNFRKYYLVGVGIVAVCCV